jgi:hypothetical protein
LTALALAAVLALPAVLGGLLGVASLPGLEWQRAQAERDALEAERARALAAEAEAARLRNQAEAARQEVGKAKGTGKH